MDSQMDPWPFAPYEPFSSMHNVDSFILGITEQCNLRCTYCCYSGGYVNNRTHSTKAMGADDIDSIFTFIDTLSPDREIRISFYGGEPLLNYQLVKYAVNTGYDRWGDRVTFSISTNGTLLTPHVIDWLVANDVELAVSIDGTEQYHDEHRVDNAGRGSFLKVSDALSYMQESYPKYYSNITIMMTLLSFKNIGEIAQTWHNDPLLKELSPTMISALAPNFNVGVERVDYEEICRKYSELLDVYQEHPDWNVLKVFFRQCITYWKDRPILMPGMSVPMATCMPINTKLYIDSDLQIAVCEKISDKYRIGSIREGINWATANAIVKEFYQKRSGRCKYCPVVRMCDMCLTAIEHSDDQWDVLCHNEQVYTRVYMYLFCEMTERGLL